MITLTSVSRRFSATVTQYKYGWWCCLNGMNGQHLFTEIVYSCENDAIQTCNEWLDRYESLSNPKMRTAKVA